MLAVFERAVGRPPEELIVPSGWMVPNSRFEVPPIFREAWPDSTFYNFANGNLMAFSHANIPHTTDEIIFYPKSSVVVDDIFCIFIGNLDNICELRRHYGLTRHATEPMLVVEAYKVYRDRAPYPADQIIKDLSGKFAFVLFDASRNTLFVARDRDGKVTLLWGAAEDESLVFSDDAEVILDICGVSSSTFPAGCIFMNGASGGLVSFDHPLNKVRGVVRESDDGIVTGVYFQVDLYSRLPSIPRVGSDANWGGDGPAPMDGP